MARNFPFKKNKQSTPPAKELSNKDQNLILNKWMSDSYKLKDSPQTEDQPELDEEFQTQTLVVGTKDPRIDTSLLKKRIADKIKNNLEDPE